jgi:hypothetical protein
MSSPSGRRPDAPLCHPGKRGRRLSGTHEHRTAQAGLQAHDQARMGPGQPLRGFRDDMEGQNPVAGRSFSRGSTLSLSEVIACAGSMRQSMPKSGSSQITPPSH